MSLSTDYPLFCGQVIGSTIAASQAPRKARHNRDMTIVPRLAAIALKKYATRPDEREPAVRMLLRNAVRLAVLHFGKHHAEELVREALLEGSR